MFPPTGAGSVICAYGEIMQDQVAVLTQDLLENGLVEAEVRVRRGGCAPNALAVIAALGVRSRFLGHEGADAVSANIVEELQRGGVRVFGTRRGRGASTLCIELPSGAITMIFDPGDSRTVLPTDVRSWWLKDAAVLHLNSYHLYQEESAPAFWAMVDLAQELKVPISLDVSLYSRLARFGLQAYREALLRIRPAVLFANESEGDLLELDTRYPDGASVVVNHRGPNPTRVYLDGSSSWEVDVPEVDRVVDTVGAGDVFAGGFLVGWMQNRSLRGCVELGHEVATKSVQSADVAIPVGDEAIGEDGPTTQ